MTIAAGFFYAGGLLLCADTQATSAAFKIHGSKLLPRDYDDGSKTIFVTVGHLSYARMGVQLAEAAIEGIPKTGRTTRAIQAAIADEIYGLYHKHLYPHPAWHTDANLRVQYLIGVWSAATRELGFFKNVDTAVERLYGYDCLGSGEQLGHYLIRPEYQRRHEREAAPRHSESYVRNLAMRAFERIKGHDPNVGGDSQWMTLTDDGQRTAGAEAIRPSRQADSGDRPTPRRTKRDRKGQPPSRV